MHDTFAVGVSAVQFERLQFGPRTAFAGTHPHTVEDSHSATRPRPVSTLSDQLRQKPCNLVSLQMRCAPTIRRRRPGGHAGAALVGESRDECGYRVSLRVRGTPAV